MANLRIGDLARLGGVSVRMLRHYHQIDLLIPTDIDDRTGYRIYTFSQLETLRMIVGLKDVGVALSDIRRVLDSSDVMALHDVLRDQRAVLSREIRDASANISAIDQLLIGSESDHTMANPTTTIEVELKPVPARVVAQLSAVAESWAPEHIGPVIQPLYPELTARLQAAGIPITGPSTAWYEDTEDGRVVVHASLTIGLDPEGEPRPDGLEIIELPAIKMAATTIHRGTMDNCDDTYQALLTWLDAEGHEAVGYSRELDIECGPGDKWITELQLEIATM